MFCPVHWIPKFVLTFLFKNLTRVLTGSPPSSHHSEIRKTAYLWSTRDVFFHTFHECSYLQCDCDELLCDSFMKTLTIFPSSNFRKIFILENHSLENFFSVSIKVLLKVSCVNKCYHRFHLRVFFFNDGLKWWQKKTNFFDFQLSSNYKLRYNVNGIRRKRFSIGRVASAGRIFPTQFDNTLFRGSADCLSRNFHYKKDIISDRK